jgi:hypothetical protein
MNRIKKVVTGTRRLKAVKRMHAARLKRLVTSVATLNESISEVSNPYSQFSRLLVERAKLHNHARRIFRLELGLNPFTGR